MPLPPKNSPLWRQPTVWAWLCLAVLPPELLCAAMGWDLLQPGYWAVLLCWWPVDLGARLAALRLLLPSQGPWRSAQQALPTALSAEVSLQLGSGVWLLLGLIPLALAASLGLGRSVGGRWLLGALGLLGQVPTGLWLLRRYWAPLEALGEAHSGPQALSLSTQRTKGRLWQAFLALLPWVALSWGLEGLAWLLPAWASYALLPLSAAALLQPLARSGQA